MSPVYAVAKHDESFAHLCGRLMYSWTALLLAYGTHGVLHQVDCAFLQRVDTADSSQCYLLSAMATNGERTLACMVRQSVS
jgi:hypothetical protein